MPVTTCCSHVRSRTICSPARRSLPPEMAFRNDLVRILRLDTISSSATSSLVRLKLHSISLGAAAAAMLASTRSLAAVVRSSDPIASSWRSRWRSVPNRFSRRCLLWCGWVRLRRRDMCSDCTRRDWLPCDWAMLASLLSPRVGLFITSMLLLVITKHFTAEHTHPHTWIIIVNN